MEHYSRIQRHWEDERVGVHGDVSDAALAEHARELLAVLVPDGTERTLDVGCGDGQVAAILRRHVGRLDGIDVAEHRTRNAAARVPDGRFWAQSFLDRYPEGNYDLVYSWSVVQYCRPTELDELVERCLEALSPEGRIVHGDVVDRAKLGRLFLEHPSPRRLLGLGRALLRRGRPIWRDGSYAHDVAGLAGRWRVRGLDVSVVPARSSYRSHVVLMRSARTTG